MRIHSQSKYARSLVCGTLLLAFVMCNCPTLAVAKDRSEDSSADQSTKVDDGGWDKLMDAANDAWDREDSTEAMNDYHQALAVAEKFGEGDSRLWTTLRKIGWANTVLNEYDEAAKVLDRSLKLAQTDKSEQGILAAIASLYGLSRLHQKQEKYTEAKTECQSAIDLLKSSDVQAPALASRLNGLRSELMLVTIEENLGHRSERPELESDLPVHPLLGGITETGEDAKLEPLKAEVPAADPLGLKKYLDGKSKVKTPTLNGSSKIRATVARMLDSYASVGLFVNKVTVTPPVIAHVLSGGPGQDAGLKKGDVILAIDGKRTNALDIPTMHFMLCGHGGEVRNLTIMRGGKEMSANVVLKKLYDFRDPVSEYIEYYWFLLYNNFVSLDQYTRLVQPYVHVLYE